MSQQEQSRSDQSSEDQQHQPHFQHQPGTSHPHDEDDEEVRFLFENTQPLPLPDHDDHIEGIDPTYLNPNFVFRPKPGITPDEAVRQRLKFEEEIRNWINFEEQLARIEQERVAALENGGPRVRMNFEAPDNMPDPDREP
jgi:hypothetical protein